MGWIEYKSPNDREADFGYMMIEFMRDGKISIYVNGDDCNSQFRLLPTDFGIEEAKKIITTLNSWIEKVENNGL